MRSTALHKRRSILVVVGVAVGYYTLAQAAVALTHGSIVITWLSAGLSVAAGIAYGPVAFIGAAIGSFAFEIGYGSPLLVAAAMALANAGSEFLAMRIMTGAGPLRWSSLRLAQGLRIFAGTMAAATTSATLGVLIYGSAGRLISSSPSTDWLILFGSVVLGMSLVTPAAATLLQERRFHLELGRPGEYAAYLLLVVTCGVLWRLPDANPVLHEGALVTTVLVIVIVALRFPAQLLALVIPAGGLAAIATTTLYGAQAGTTLALADILSLQFGITVVATIGYVTATLAAEQSRALAGLRLSAQVFESAHEAIVITDADANVVDANDAFLQLHRVSREDLIGENPRVFKSGRHDDRFYEEMWAELLTTGHWQGEIWNRRTDGTIFPKILSIAAVRDRRGVTTHYVGISTDISEIKEAESRLLTLATQDPLTGLLNRSSLAEHIEAALTRARRSGTEVGVIFLDVDHFKRVNDSMGHTTGDRLLVEVGARLKAVTREVDSVFRHGGDEFVIVVPDLVDPLALKGLSTRILDSLTLPYRVDDTLVTTSASLGIAVFPTDGQDATELMAHADVAMYRAKELGRNRSHFFSASLQAEFHQRVAIETGLLRALENDELFLVYQPQVDLASGRIESVEALIRWRREDGTLHSPAEFIPVAEESGLIVPIGAWVLARACRDVAHLRERGHQLGVSVNISARQFHDFDLIGEIDRALSDAALDPSALELEITETALMNSPGETAQLLGRVRQRGVRLALDDFGTGYSSLSYVQLFKPDRLKIDRFFVGELPGSADAATIVRAALAMAEGLGVEVVAEGVETAEQLAFLVEHGCHSAQGYLFAAPLGIGALTELLGNRS